MISGTPQNGTPKANQNTRFSRRVAIKYSPPGTTPTTIPYGTLLKREPAVILCILKTDYNTNIIYHKGNILSSLNVGRVLCPHMNNEHMHEYRCSCNKLLCRGTLVTEAVEIKCSRCQTMNLFKGGTVIRDAPAGPVAYRPQYRKQPITGEQDILSI